MPQGEKSKGKSWSLRNMLGRKRAKNGSSSKDPAAECASVKERVLAKLQEPLSNEKEAARHSVDDLRAPIFSPRLSYDGHEHFSQLKDAFAAAGQGYRDSSQPTSTSSWQFEREPAQSRSSSSAFQASPSASSTTSASIVNTRSTQHGISSPVSNVIARLMGLDAHETSTHIKLKTHSLRAEASSSSESSSRGRQGQPSTRQGHTRTEDVHRNEAWKQEMSPCLLQQPKQQQPRAKGKPVEEVTIRSPRQPRHVFLSHGCINQDLDAKASPQAHHTREYRMERAKDPAQDFLDEMEEELKQCDKALERIEAVMQLKRRLLYLSRSAGEELRVSCRDVEHNFLDYTKADRSIHRGEEGHVPRIRIAQGSPVPSSHVSRCNGRVQSDSSAQHVRAHSLDHRQRALWEEEQSWEQMQQLPEDEYYYSNTRGARSKTAGMGGGHPPQMKLESQSPRPFQQPPQVHKRFLHRRSVSDGETPVFSLTEGGYGFEAARACITKVMGPSSPVFNKSRLLHSVAQFLKDSECNSDVPKTPEHRTPSAQCSGDKQRMTDFFQVEEACMLSSRSRPQIQHKPVPEAMCEQPSPVSVLDNAQDDSPRSSEDYEAFKPDNAQGSIDEVGGDEIKRKSVVRALWRTRAENDVVVEKKAEGRSNPVFQPAVRDNEELVKEMQKTWSGFSSEIAEVAVAVECMILKKLVEETIILYMMMP